MNAPLVLASVRRDGLIWEGAAGSVWPLTSQKDTNVGSSNCKRFKSHMRQQRLRVPCLPPDTQWCRGSKGGWRIVPSSASAGISPVISDKLYYCMTSGVLTLP